MSERFHRLKLLGRTLLGKLGVKQGLFGSSLEVQYPVLKPLRDLYDTIVKTDNVRELFRTLKIIDPELSGAIDRVAKMVRFSYKGIGVHLGHELSESETELLKELELLESQFDFKGHFYTIADQLLTYGDACLLKSIVPGTGLVKLTYLPMEKLTILESERDLNSQNNIMEPNIYVLNETDESKRKIWKKEEVLHVSLNNKASVIYDLKGRYTFGIWSMSPIEPLKPKLLWKLALMINDIILRQHLVPRQHHKLDLSMYRPELFPGNTLEERYAAAKKAAEAHIKEYSDTVAAPLKEVDKSVITDKSTEITYLEPSKVTYIDPNPLMDQINQSIWSSIAPIETAVTGRGTRSYASELVVTSYTTMCAETIADIIRVKFVQLAKEHIEAKFKDSLNHENSKIKKEDLDKIDIKVQVLLGLEKGELVRQVAVLSAIPLLTYDELRDVLGYDPLTEDGKQELTNRAGPGRIGQFDRTLADIYAKYIERIGEPSEPETTESKRQRQKT